jgi:hypothetical protein
VFRFLCLPISLVILSTAKDLSEFRLTLRRIDSPAREPWLEDASNIDSAIVLEVLHSAQDDGVKEKLRMTA